MLVTQGEDSRLLRALLGLPILALSALMSHVFGMASPMAPIFETMLANSQFDWNGVQVRLVADFYGVSLVDTIFSHITIAFGQLQFFGDQRAYWHALVFLTEFAGLYAILFFESLRRANQSTLFRFPFLLAMAAQVISIGFLAPLYFYLLYVFTPVKKLTSANFRITNWYSCAAVLPTLILAYYIPHFPSFFHPSLEARHWWNWIWQLFPLWASVSWFVFAKMAALYFPDDSEGSATRVHQIPIIRNIVGILAAINIAVWWGTVYQSAFSPLELFVPKYLSEKPEAPDVALRTIIQYDYLCSSAAAFLWLALHLRDFQSAGLCKVRVEPALFAAAIFGSIFGPGTLLLLIWLIREELLTLKAH